MLKNGLLSQRISNALQKGLLGKLGEEEAKRWIEDARELETSQIAIGDVKAMLATPGCRWKKGKVSFKAEDIMSDLGWTGWRRLGAVKSALHDLCEDKTLAMLDHGTPAVYSFRSTDRDDPSSVEAAKRDTKHTLDEVRH